MGAPRSSCCAAARYGRYVATGHVLYVQQATLFAVPFDLETLTVTGNAMPVIEGVLSFANTGGAHFSVSDSGTLVYVSGRSVGRESPIHLLDAAGKTTLHRTAVADWSSRGSRPTVASSR